MSPTRFVVVSHPRSGTKFLRGILDRHPDIRETGEMFHSNPKVIETSHSLFECLGGERLVVDNVGRFLSQFTSTHTEPIVGVTVFNRTSGHTLSDQEVARLVLKQDIRPVFLIRKNLLKAWVSYQRAKRTGAWHLDATEKVIHWSYASPLPNALHHPIGRLDVTAAQKWIDSVNCFLAHVRQALDNARKSYLTVYYEDLCLGGATMTLVQVNRVLDYLGATQILHYEKPSSQTASTEAYESIVNREELMNATGYDLDFSPVPDQIDAGLLLSSPILKDQRLQIESWHDRGLSIAVAPAGLFVRDLLRLSILRPDSLECFFDLVSKGTCHGIAIRPYDDIHRLNPDLILVASPKYEEDIVQDLLHRGWPADRVIKFSDL